METLAQQGRTRFLIAEPEQGMARIYDRQDGTLSVVLPIQSALARGYWEDPSEQVPDAELGGAKKARGRLSLG